MSDGMVFQLTHAAMLQANEQLWAQDRALGRAPTRIENFCRGTRQCEVWFTDPTRAVAYQAILDADQVAYTLSTARTDGSPWIPLWPEP